MYACRQSESDIRFTIRAKMWRTALLAAVLSLNLPPCARCDYQNECERSCFEEDIGKGDPGILAVTCTADYLFSVRHTTSSRSAEKEYLEYECKYQNGTVYIGPIEIPDRNEANINVSPQSDDANTFCTVRGCYRDRSYNCKYYQAVSDHCRQDECTEGNHSCEHAQCIDTPDSFECGNCSQGFGGYGVNCTDIDECGSGSHNCSQVQHSTCNNTIGGYDCVCDPGFTKDGDTCINIDECYEYEPCHPNATCNDTEGGFTCSCNHRYIGNGTDCSYDECEDQPCHSNATCKDTPKGSFNCTCKDGYTGNGTHCSSVYSVTVPTPHHSMVPTEAEAMMNSVIAVSSVTLPTPHHTTVLTEPKAAMMTSVIAVPVAVSVLLITTIVSVVFCITFTRQKAKRLQAVKAFSAAFDSNAKLPVEPMPSSSSFISLVSEFNSLIFKLPATDHQDSGDQKELLFDTEQLLTDLKYFPSFTSEDMQYKGTATDKSATEVSTLSSPTESLSPGGCSTSSENPKVAPQFAGSESADYIHSHTNTTQSSGSVPAQGPESSAIDEIELDILDSEECIQENVQTFAGGNEGICGTQTSCEGGNEENCGCERNPSCLLAETSREALEEHIKASTEKPLHHSKELHIIPFHFRREKSLPGTKQEERGDWPCTSHQVTPNALTEIESSSNNTSGISSLGYASLRDDKLLEAFSHLTNRRSSTQSVATSGYVTDSGGPRLAHGFLEDLGSCANTSNLTDSSTFPISPCSLDDIYDISMQTDFTPEDGYGTHHLHAMETPPGYSDQ